MVDVDGPLDVVGATHPEVAAGVDREAALVREHLGGDVDRKALGRAAEVEPDPARPRYLLTEAGAGYRLVNPVARS